MAWGCHCLVMPESLARALGNGDPFENVMQLRGEVFRDVPGRRTLRVELAGQTYFAKLHDGVGWREIFKNLLTLRLPVISARTEWRAIQRLEALGIPTTPAVAYGCRGTNPATLRSFILTRDLGDIVSLEDYCRDWIIHPPALQVKRHILRRVAHIARSLHEHGLNHRDFYLCHFCLDRRRLAEGEVHLYLIDLHRMQLRAITPATARMKDIAALYFSALDIGLSARDCLRFLRQYRDMPLRDVLRREPGFWKAVDRRARKLYYKFHGRWPTTPFDGTAR
ncbi:MAG: lipopolysaccharide core heptose(I) kinase RfaP [Methylophilaceae bacterium]|nr:lipopolysaccharide core heptose(I) kinase RfaP [Methylophilaceae bacterium]